LTVKKSQSQLVLTVETPRLTDNFYGDYLHFCTTETFMRKTNKVDFQLHCEDTG
jgi:hypothetical protein